MFRSIKKRYNWLTNVRFDKQTGFYCYQRFGQKIFIRHPRHFFPENDNKWVCDNIFFHYYMPQNNDQVVDLGAGYGEEAVYLSTISPDIKY